MRLRRSMSTHIQFEDALKTIPLIPPSSSFFHCPSNKRYSADYTNIKRSATQCHHPESFNGLGKRRPSSVDLLLTATTISNNRISRMSLQFKSNQMNAIKMAVGHKLRDVSTQDYLSLRAWNMRERDQIAYYQKKVTTPTQPDELYSDTTTTNMSNKSTSYNNNSNDSGHLVTNNSNNGSGNSRKLSASFLRSSASSLSLMIPKRTADVKTRHSDSATVCSSPLDHITEPSTHHSVHLNSKKPALIVDVSSNILFEAAVPSTTTEKYEEVKNQDLHPLQLPSVSPPSASPPSQIRQEKILERKKSSGRIMANKVLQRMKSFRHSSKKPTPASVENNK